MFLHTNMSPKWNLAIPADFDYYTRRWQVRVHIPASVMTKLVTHHDAFAECVWPKLCIVGSACFGGYGEC